ncbi:MAG: PP0621 family protein [Pseudomonadota bacterium]|nr:PP0621 family protein [Pseudomonadota bacterium]
MKFFLLLGLFLLVAWLARGGRRGTSARVHPPPSQRPPVAQDFAREDMVACVHCGIHLPQSEAVAASAGWFCGQAHRIAHEKTPPH